MNDTRRAPHVPRPVIEAGHIGPAGIERLCAELPLSESFVVARGTTEGLDSTRWSVENDDALAQLAAERLHGPQLRSVLLRSRAAGRDASALGAVRDEIMRSAPSEARALDLVAARLIAVEGLTAYEVHRRLRQSAAGVSRLLLEAIGSGVLRGDEVLEWACALARHHVYGHPRPQSVALVWGSALQVTAVGDLGAYAWPDVLCLVGGVPDVAVHAQVLREVEDAITQPSADVERTLRWLLARASSALGEG